MKNRLLCPELIAFGVVTLGTAIIYGAEQTANLYGRVVDRLGAALPGVTVILEGETVKQVQVSNANGEFRFLSLPPATFTLKAELPGFATVVYPKITSSIGRNTSVEITMDAGEITEEISTTSGGDQTVVELEAFWNTWIEGENTVVDTVEPGKDYTVYFDLSGLDYRKLNVVGSLAVPVSATLLQYLASLPASVHTVKVSAMPVVVGSGVSLPPGVIGRRRKTLILDRLRQTPQLIKTLNSSDLRTVSGTLNALRLDVDVHIDGPGCPVVGFALFDDTMNRSLGFVGLQIPIGGDAAAVCSPPPTGGRLNTSLASLITSPSVTKADASLLILDFDESPITTKTVVVFEDSNGRMSSWRPLHSLSDYAYSLADGGLRKDLALAHCKKSPSTGCVEDFSSVIANFARVLFYDRTEAGQKTADKAYGTLNTLAATATSGRRPTVMFRFVDNAGVTRILPFGLIGLTSKHMLGEYVTIVQALPTERYVSKDACVSKWSSLLPKTLASVSATYLQQIVPSVPSVVDSFADFSAFLSTPTDVAATSPPEGILILAHYLPEGELKFDPQQSEGLVAEGIRRYFGSGSIAVVAACGTASLSPTGHDQPLITILNDHRIDAMIVSPFDINADLGARLAAHFSNRVQIARSSRKATLLDIFQVALQDTRSDPKVKDLYEELNEFVLVGNGGMQVCP